ncbi:TKFC, partial [Symbiodinium pilosum]
ASRCLAGAAVVIKVAGSLAEAGKELREVREAAQLAADATKTMALALRWRGVDWILELGVGIHGEAGVQELPSLASLPGASDGCFAAAVVRALLRELLPATKLQPGDEVVVVLNNLGGTSPLEMSVLCDAAFRQLRSRGAVVAGYVQGTLVTCLDMHGASLSLIPLREAPANLVEFLAAPAEVNSAWPGLLIPPIDSEVVIQEAAVPPLPAETAVKPAETQLRKAISAACEMLILDSTVKALDEMDFECGDADCGGTHRDAAEALMATIEAVPSSPDEALRFLAAHLEHQCRGAIGGIYVLGLEAAAKCVGRTPLATDWAKALAAAGRAIQDYGGAKAGDRTILDAVLPAAEALRAHAESPDALAEAVRAAKQGAKRTQQMLAKKGRAVHVPPSRQARSPDPGAVGFAKWLEAVERALRV